MNRRWYLERVGVVKYNTRLQARSQDFARGGAQVLFFVVVKYLIQARSQDVLKTLDNPARLPLVIIEMLLL